MEERLQEFGLKMEDIVAATTDEASVMKSVGFFVTNLTSQRKKRLESERFVCFVYCSM